MNRSRSKLWTAALAAVGVALTVATTASADDSAYCRKVRARAGADAALLFAPSIQAQGIRFPKNGTVDVGVTTGTDLQVRGAVTWSPLEFYKGFQVQNVGDADCEQHAPIVSAAEVLLLGVDYGRLPALKKELAFLDEKRAVWEGIVAKNDERVTAHVVSALDATEVRGRAAELDKKRVIVMGDIARLDAKGLREYDGKLGALVQEMHDSAMRYERQVSHVRRLDPWQVTMSGGVIPSVKPADYFAMVQLGYNFGGLVRSGREAQYLDARQEELSAARYELTNQLRRFRAELKAALTQAKSELAITAKQRASLGELREALAQSEAPLTPHALAIVDLEILSVETERVFLVALVGELSRLQEVET